MRRARAAGACFGVAMICIGLAASLLPAAWHWTALIPAVIGAGALAAAAVGRHPAAVWTVAALAAVALFGSAGALPSLPTLLAAPESLANPTAVAARAASAACALAVLAALAVLRPWRRQAGAS